MSTDPLAYRAADLKLIGAFCATPDGGEGGIWQSGAGLSGDGENVYCVVGNGKGKQSRRNLGNSVVKLHMDQRRGHLDVVDSFTPQNVQELNKNDLDLSTGAVLVGDGTIILACDKTGTCYVLGSQSMTKALAQFAASTYTEFGGQAPEQNPHSHIHGTPVVWDYPGRRMLYVWGEHDYLKAYLWDGKASTFAIVGQSPMHVPVGMPGGILSLSANADNEGTGIVWATHPSTGDANQATVDGVLRAFDAMDVSVELWNSEQWPKRDRLGKFAKFCPPVVANGKVYIATFADPLDSRTPNQLVVYGQLPNERELTASDWLQADVGTPIVGSAKLESEPFTVTGSGWDIDYVTDEFHYVYQRRAGDCSIVARVLTVQKTDKFAKAGVMIRYSLDTGSAHGTTVLMPSPQGAEFECRSVAGTKQFAVTLSEISAPYWVRVERKGHQLIGSVSADGKDWAPIGGAQTVNLGSQVLIGLAVTSHHAQAADLCTSKAQFDNVKISPP